MELVNNLNEQQLKAVTTTAQQVRVVAGAGSGKTRVLTTRIGHLIKNNNVYSNKILAITFTNKAANEMKERIRTQLGEDGERVHVSTIHSLCVRILREDIETLGYPSEFIIVDTQDQRSILKDAYRELNIDGKNYTYGSLLSYISNNKSAEVDYLEALELAEGSISEENKAKIYRFYQKRLDDLKALDFDDLLLKTVQMFRKFPELKRKWQHRFNYIHVDEFQDIDNIQYELIRQLAGEENHLYVVGDPDQTIYTWRGANVNIIMNFDKDYPKADTIVLNQNYRSTSPILKGANSIIANNKNRVDKELFTEIESDDLITHFSAASEDHESIWISNEIEKLREEGVDYNQIAILYRANYLSRAVEKGLLDYKIPYVIYGGTRFYERQEVKDALSYLRMLSSADDLAFGRIVNNPRRGVGNKSIETIRNQAELANISMYQAVCDYDILSGKAKTEVKKLVEQIEAARARIDNNEKIHIVLKDLLTQTKYIEMLEDSQEKERLENIQELLGDIESYENENPDSDLEEYLQMISLYTDKSDYDTGSFVQLMTIHAAKGLEFDYVFVAKMSEGIFPSERTLAEGEDGIEEERRLAYVAYTRARKKLYLTESGGYSYVLEQERTKSRFIKEIDGNFIRQVGQPKESNKSEIGLNMKMMEPSVFKRSNRRTGIKENDKVKHQVFGEGIVLKIDGGGVAEIAFPHPHGIKHIRANHKSLNKKG